MKTMTISTILDIRLKEGGVEDLPSTILWEYAEHGGTIIKHYSKLITPQDAT